MSASSGHHAFISYVREDKEPVDRIQRILEAAGVPVWRDTEDLWPGEDWKAKIRDAITNNALVFIACFSENSQARERTFQNEELVLAIDQLRLRRPNQPWLIPVRLSPCSLPAFDLGAGRTLDSLQRVDLFEANWDEGIARLVAGVLRVVDTLGLSSAVAHSTTTPSKFDFVKRALLEPARQIELEDHFVDLAGAAAAELGNEEKFPASSERLTNDSNGYRYLVDQANLYWETIVPLLDALIVGITWGRPEHNRIWTKTVERIGNTARDGSGQTALVSLRRFPILPLLYGTSLAALHRDNFEALRAVAVDAKFRSQYGTIPLLGAAHVWRPFQQAEMAAQILALEAAGEEVSDETIALLTSGRKGKRHTPVSDLLHDRLRGHFARVIPDDHDYTSEFDRLEVLLGAMATDLELQARETGAYLDGAWFGSFTWRHRLSGPAIEQEMLAEATSQGDDWAPVKAGLFGRSSARAKAALAAFSEEAANARRHRW